MIDIFSAEFTRQAAKFISKLDSFAKKRVKNRIEKLEKEPFPQEVEKVEDYLGEKVFRVRVGDLRILFIVRYNPNKIIITKVDKRERVYD